MSAAKSRDDHESTMFGSSRLGLSAPAGIASLRAAAAYQAIRNILVKYICETYWCNLLMVWGHVYSSVIHKNDD